MPGSAVLVPTASEAEWLEARRQGVTASEIAVLMGLSPYDSPYGLYHRKLGILPQQEPGDAMELGDYLEAFIAGKFAEFHPEFFIEGDGRQLYAHPERAWQLATPDRTLTGRASQDTWAGFIAAREVAVLECKVDGGSDEWGEPGTDEIPVHYRCQVLWQCRVMGVRDWYVACLQWNRRKVRVYAGVIDQAAEDDITLMESEALDFLARIKAGEPPDVDWRPATIAALKTLHPSVEDTTAEIGPQLADRWEASCRNEKHWERRRKLYEARIRQQAGAARRIVRAGPGQVPVARRDVYPVREHVRKASTVDKLVPTPPKDTKS